MCNMCAYTGVNLSNVLGGQSQMFGGGQNVVKIGKWMGVSRFFFWGGGARAAPQSLRLCAVHNNRDEAVV